ALEKGKLRREVQRLRSVIEKRYSFSNIIGKSKAMQAIFTTITRIADKKSTVLITGESGTGKELIAKAIHFNSDRRDKPFISINCAALPETLIESEMFGHEKGAFTDAHQSKAGQFELANGGTILLDEIGELALYTQAKLLRVLQEREFIRVGGTKKINVDVRVVTSTNQNLLKALDEKKFREDLYYRINVLPIALPSLRERPEDIPLLIEHFLGKYLEKGRKLAFSRQAVKFLMEYDWPGNVRELENMVERTVVLHQGDVVQIEDLPVHIQENGRIIKIREEVLSGQMTMEGAVEAFEKDLILNALKRSNVVQIKTAKRLGISRRMLKYKIDKYGINLKNGDEADRGD
ncbi:sigma-54 interaction domain-containing protein, partial [Acidobacteriota bacterium]